MRIYAFLYLPLAHTGTLIVWLVRDALVDWKTWQSVDLSERQQLPNSPGIYVVVDGLGEVWYVGQAVDLNVRWRGKAHHRYRQLSRSHRKRKYRIHWQIFSTEQLDECELHYIKAFKPHLNYQEVKRYVRPAIQPEKEISRILKVINRKTLLFPDCRSIVLGYYKELDEDEIGDRREYVSVVIGVNVKDHDQVILASYDRSFKRKYQNSSGYWYMFDDLSDGHEASLPSIPIPVFPSGIWSTNLSLYQNY